MTTKNEQADEPLRPLLIWAGRILFLLQQLENVVRLCCAFLKIKGINITVDDLFSNEQKKNFKTLGSMLKPMKEPMGFKPSFTERLDDFIKARNTFIHDYWVKNEIYSIDQPIDQVTFQKIASFEEALYSETIYMIQVFIGLSYSIGAVLASQQGRIDEFENYNGYEKMNECVPIFLSVLENEQN